MMKRITTEAAINRPHWFASAVLMGALLGGLTLGIPTAGNADTPGKHAGYIHALNDLREARSLLTVTGNKKVTAQQKSVAVSIGAAMWDLHRAAAYDKKNVKSDVMDTAAAGSGGNLHRAMNLLLDARKQLSYQEDNKKAQGWGAAALGHTNTSITTLNEIIKVTGSAS